MCGIFGWFTPGRFIDAKKLVSANNSMRHRGPDDEGYLSWDSKSGLIKTFAGRDTDPAIKLPSIESAVLGDFAFGFRRLSIHDLTSAGHQPMCSLDGKVAIVYNGEVYNFIELRNELQELGYQFHSATDTEVVLAAYLEWGIKCFSRFNGMWGMAILDIRDENDPALFISRDRCGVKTVFYAEDAEGGICFSSELKAILETGDDWSADEVAVSNFLVWGRLPSERNGDTFVAKIRRLPPGCYGEFRSGKFTIERYWDITLEKLEELSPSDAAFELRVLLEDSISLRQRSDVQVGSCLSGGVDSSVIVGQINSSKVDLASKQHTFSAVYHTDGAFNEEKYINKVLSHTSATSHFVFPTAEKLVSDFSDLIWHQDEPFPNTSMFAQWCVMESAKMNGVKVLLDGQAADELFGGYRPYQVYFRDLLSNHSYKKALSELAIIYKKTGDFVIKKFLIGIITALCPSKLSVKIAMLAYLREVRKKSRKILRTKSLSDNLMAAIADSNRPESYPWRRVTESLPEHLRGLVVDFVLPILLRYEDRNSMAHSVEARVPFTDYRIVEFAFSGKIDSYKIYEGWSKWVLRKACEDLAPADIIWRKDKMGFGTPEHEYMQHLTTAWISCGKRFSCSAKVINQDFAEDLIARISNKQEVALEKLNLAFRILVVEEWLERFRLKI